MQEDRDDFHLFFFNSGEEEQYPDREIQDQINLEGNSNTNRINQYQRELDYYSRRLSNENQENVTNQSNLIHFDFNAEQNQTNDSKPNYEKKKNKTISYSDNLSLIERIKESNLHYVGFENKNGENSCYLNVILHFLYYFPCINEFLIKFYINSRSKFINITQSSSSENEDYFFFLLGKTLFEYQSILSDYNNKNIAILQTLELRKELELISKHEFPLNKIGDTVELLIFILNKINERNNLEVHKYFFINLREEIKCNDFCKKKEINLFDKDNFIHHIYVEDVFKYINRKYLTFNEYYTKLFYISKCNTENHIKKCKNCNTNGNTILKLVSPNYPTFFLLNCVWNNPKPKLNDVLRFFYLLSLEDTLQNLFHCGNNKINLIYNLLGMILYSGVSTHYISVMFNIEKNLFVLYNDDKIKEFSSIHEVYKEITAEQMKNNPDVFYYPVLLIYYKEIIYNDKKTTQLNEYSFSKYNNLVEYCDKIKKNYVHLTKEQKEKNHLELIKAQIKFDRKMSVEQRNNVFEMIIEEESDRKSVNNINKNINNNINNINHINVENSDNMILEERQGKIFEFENDEEEKENNNFIRFNKKYGTEYKKRKIFPPKNYDFFQDIM